MLFKAVIGADLSKINLGRIHISFCLSFRPYVAVAFLQTAVGVVDADVQILIFDILFGSLWLE